MRQAFGQNFLIDKNIALKIVNSLELDISDTVIEIGPGKGILTDIIYKRIKKLIAVEIDPKLAVSLTERYCHYSNIQVINNDILTYKIPQNIGKIKFISNLPYNIATAVIEKILPLNVWSTAVFMIQKEMAERILSGPGNKKYGYFSLFCQYYADISSVYKVQPQSFFPKPKVESIVLKFINKFPLNPDKKVFELIKLAFQQRRKTLVNALANNLQYSKDEISLVLKELKINPNDRPENLNFQQFNSLTLRLKKYII